MDPTQSVLNLSTSSLVLLDVDYIVMDVERAEKDPLIGMFVLRHLWVDTKTLIQKPRDVLDGLDCAMASPSCRSKKLIFLEESCLLVCTVYQMPY